MITDDEVPAIQIRFVTVLTRIAAVAEKIVLFFVALAIIYVAVMLITDSLYDALFLWSSHTIPHLLSEMLFTLIIMELFRQVLRRFNNQPFCLNPYLFIGFIATIRGMLLTQMSLGMDEIEWKHGIMEIIVYAVVLLMLVVAYFINARSHRDGDPDDTEPTIIESLKH